MSVLDNALQTLFKLGIEVKLIWQNASITSQFEEQTLSLLMSKNSMIYMIYRYANDDTTNAPSQLCSVGEGVTQFASGGVNGDTNPSFRVRTHRISEDGITFRNCYTKTPSSWTTPRISNENLIPYKIYTIKLLGGGSTEN